ncbi:hypothetical protein GA0061098_102113 [Bradyrhizobium shewense]|uniref:Uncharacterized protein n=1 Tax=Bradyrhizobium shewense TaxID=1761772 RepID=A0A1C3XP29_9BRAD|nr:hypothetical protein [Bradyrhizobium shewense]SCB53806.1 hypothetical protein GA0061098_102113 [Bradyrhizobium shewense]
MDDATEPQRKPAYQETTEAFVPTPRWLYLSAELARIERKFRLDQDHTESRTILFGKATIDLDRVSIATDTTNTTCELTCSIETASDKPSRDPWAINVGYNSINRELGLPDEWFVACYLPKESFDQLESEFLAKNARYVSASCTTDMCVSKADFNAPLAQGVTWLLQPGHYSNPKMGLGKLTMFRWSLAPQSLSTQNPYIHNEHANEFHGARVSQNSERTAG